MREHLQKNARRYIALLTVIALLVVGVGGAFALFQREKQPDGGVVTDEQTVGTDVGTAAVLLTLTGTAGNAADINLTADIDMTGQSWTTIPAFAGTINGNGHVLIGLTSPLVASMTGGTIQNIGLVNSTVSGTALLCETISGGSITNSFATGTLAGGEGTYVGGLIGRMTGGTVSSCFADTVVSGTKENGYIGGFAGLIETGSVNDCYVTGTLNATGSYMHAGGFTCMSGTPTVNRTYATVQMGTPGATLIKASGVNGLYDNQLGITREGPENTGSTTAALMQGKNSTGGVVLNTAAWTLTDAYYPRLTAFLTGWSPVAADAVKVSAAALSLTEVGTQTKYEPAGFARADYMTTDFYADRTHDSGLNWTLDNANVTVRDTVPTTMVGVTSGSVGGFGNLLRAQYTMPTTQALTFVVSAGNGGIPVSRTISVNANTQNPYFAGGNGSSGSHFTIATAQQLSAVRLYSQLADCFYELTADISDWSVAGDFYPIDNFRGDFNGNGRALSGLSLADAAITDRTALGVFGSVNSGVIQNLAVTNITVAGAPAAASVGGLAGTLTGGASLTNVMVSGRLTGADAVGGIAGTITNGTVSGCSSTGLLIATAATGKLGGIVGAFNGGTVSSCCSTTVLNGKDYACTIGGLIGSNTAATLSGSYFAGMIDGSAAVKNALCGGTAPTASGCFYNHENTDATTTFGTAKTNAEMTGVTLGLTGFTAAENTYPQPTWATAATSGMTKKASALASHALSFQHGYLNGAAKGFTTGAYASSSSGSTLTAGYETADGQYADAGIATNAYNATYTAFWRSSSLTTRKTLMTLSADNLTRYVLLDNTVQTDVTVQTDAATAGAFVTVGGHTMRATTTPSAFLPTDSGRLTLSVQLPAGVPAAVTATDENGTAVTVTPNGGGSFTVDTVGKTQLHLSISTASTAPWGVYRAVW